MTKLPFSHPKTQLHILIIFFLLPMPFLVTSRFSPAVTERATLLKLKTEWGNPQILQSWNRSSSPCAWTEIQCSGDGDGVTGILLNNYNISGIIPDSISALQNLKVLDLGFNFFMGNFPPAILNCSKLLYLDLSQNYFVGNIPPNIDKLKSLRYLDLSANNFSGDVPTGIGNLTELRTLNFYMTLLKGNIHIIDVVVPHAEYAYTSKVDEKIDVYSFGVVLLELVTGKEPNNGDMYTGLAEWAWNHYGQGKAIVDALDKEITETHFVDDMIGVFKLGLMCTNSPPASRPTMREVSQILQRCGSANENIEKQ